jgi:hypothetical protein
VRFYFNYVLLAADIALVAACGNPMEPAIRQAPELARPLRENCEVAAESDSLPPDVPLELYCARVRQVCG